MASHYMQCHVLDSIRHQYKVSRQSISGQQELPPPAVVSCVSGSGGCSDTGEVASIAGASDAVLATLVSPVWSILCNV